MTTVLRKHTKQYHHKSRFTRYLQYFRDDVGPSLIVTNCTLDFANSTLGFARVGVLFGYFLWFFFGIFYGFPFGRRASQSVSEAASQSVG